jgi:hypothetical protein
MFVRNVGKILVAAVAVTAICAGAYAEKTVYKWVDEDGVAHFSDSPPAESNPGDTETLTIPKTPPSVAPVQPAAPTPAASVPVAENQSTQPQKEMPPLYEKIDISKMSVSDLDLRCDEAREKMITPLREAEIAECKQDKRRDPEWCERFNADFGDGGRTVSGSIRPRMFDDLPECVEALEERNRRRR